MTQSEQYYWKKALIGYVSIGPQIISKRVFRFQAKSLMDQGWSVRKGLIFAYAEIDMETLMDRNRARNYGRMMS